MMPEKAANVRVLVRIRPLNDRERANNGNCRPSGVLSVDNGRRRSGVVAPIDFGSGEGGEANVTVHDFAASSSSAAGAYPALSSGYGSGYGSDGGYGSDSLVRAGGVGGGKTFTFDAVHGPRSTQADVFESVKNIVEAVAEGYNGTIVAYGQTGSGKTHTVFGNDDSKANVGLVERCLQALFRSIAVSQAEAATASASCPHESSGGPPSSPEDNLLEESFEESRLEDGSIRKTTAHASFYEIFNEKVYDLLSEGDSLQQPLSVRKDEERGVYVDGVTTEEVGCIADARAVLARGASNRHVASTAMNRTSSRSHAVFVLTVKSVHTSADGLSKVRTSKFTLVDLAGSERQKSTDAAGERLKEASMINTSLLALGNVIKALVDREQGGRQRDRHVPFRESKLTFLLSDSWGGNSKTCLVATVSPSALALSETMSTLEFAQRAKQIKNKAVLNEDTCGTVSALQAEVNRLKMQLEKAAEENAKQQAHPLALATSAPSPSLRPSLSRPPLPARASRASSSPSSLSSTKKNGVASPSGGGGYDSDRSQSESDLVTVLRRRTRRAEKDSQEWRNRATREAEKTCSLKRKILEETMVRKFKQRRIDYLSKRVVSGYDADADEEIETLCGEIDALRRQVDAPSVEAVELKVAYEQAQEELEEIMMERDEGQTLDREERQRLDDTVEKLLTQKEELDREKNDLEKKVAVLATSTSEMQREIDSILPEVERLEVELATKEEKIASLEEQVKSANERASSAEANGDRLQLDLTVTREEKAKLETRLAELQESAKELERTIERLNKEVDEKTTAAEEIREAGAKAEDELNARLAEASQQLEESRASLKEKGAVESELGEKLAAILEENSTLAKQIEESANKLEEQKSIIQEAETRMQSLRKEHDDAADLAQTNLERTRTSLQERISELDGEKNGLREELSKVEEAKDEALTLQAAAKAEAQDLKLSLAKTEQRLCVVREEKANSEKELQRMANEAGASFAANLQGIAQEKKRLESQIAAHKAELEEARVSAESEAARMKAQHESVVNTLEQNISSLEREKARIVEESESDKRREMELRETKLKSMEEEKMALHHQVAELTTKIDEASARESNVKGNLVQSEAVVSKLQVTIEELEERSAQLQEERDRTISQGQTNLDSIKESMSSRVEELESERNTLREKVQALKSTMEETEETHRASLAEQARLSKAAIKELEQKLDAVGTEHEQAMAAVKKKFEEASATLEARIQSLGEERSSLCQRIASLEAALAKTRDDAKVREATIVGEATQKATMVTKLQATIKELEVKSASLQGERDRAIAEGQSNLDSIKEIMTAKVEKLENERGALLEKLQALNLSMEEVEEAHQSLLVEEGKRREAAIEDLENKLEVVEKEKDRAIAVAENNFKETHESLEARIRSLDEEKSALCEKISSLEAAHKQAKAMAAVATSEDLERQNSHQAEIKALKDEWELVANEARAKMQTELDAKDEELKIVRGRHTEATAEIGLLTTDRDSLRKQVADLEVAAKELKKTEGTAAVAAKELDRCKEALECANKQIKSAEEDKERAVDEASSKAQTALETKQEELSDARAQTEVARVEVARLSQCLEEVQQSSRAHIADAMAQRQKLEGEFSFKIEMLEVENKTLQAQASDWEQQADKALAKNRQLEDKLKISKRAKESIQFELDTLREDHGTLTEQMRALNEGNGELKQENEKLRAQLCEKIYATLPNAAPPNPALPEQQTTCTPFRDLSSKMDNVLSRMSTGQTKKPAADDLADDSFDESMFLPNHDASMTAPSTPEFLGRNTKLHPSDEKENSVQTPANSAMRTPTRMKSAKKSAMKSSRTSAKKKSNRTPLMARSAMKQNGNKIITRSALKRMPLSERKNVLTSPLSLRTPLSVKKYPQVASETIYRTGWSNNLKR